MYLLGLLEQLQPVDCPVLISSKNRPRSMTKLLPVPVDEPAIDKTYKLFYGGGHKRPNSNIHKTVINGNGKNIAIVPEANRYVLFYHCLPLLAKRVR